MRRSVRALLACAVALSALTAQAPAPVAACVSLPAPFDSFTDAVPAAGTIVLGTVEGRSGRETVTGFRLTIDEVVRGKAPAAMRFNGLSGSKRRSACGDRNYVVAHDGDRLALAMNEASPGQPLRVDAVAFVGKSVPDRRTMRKVERLPARQVRRLAGAPADGSSSRHPSAIGRASDGLFIERVDRGVARVQALGNAHDLRTIRHLDVGADDRVWAAAPDRAFKLSAGKEFEVDSATRLSGIETQPDGGALGAADGIWYFNGKTVWRQLGTEVDDGLYAPHGTGDGKVWALSERGHAVLFIRENSWAYTGWDEVGAPEGCLAEDGQLACDLTSLVDAPDGSLWLGFAGRDPGQVVGGIRRFDGESWGPVPDPVDGAYAVRRLASEAEGPVWALVMPQSIASDGAIAQLARWDGLAWALFDLPPMVAESADDQGTELVASPDVSAWLSQPLTRFDGESWARYDIPGRSGPGQARVTDLSMASDGTAWMVVRSSSASGKTRADGIYILDPKRATPVASEAGSSVPATEEPSVQLWTSEGIKATSDLKAIAEANGWTIDQAKAQERASRALRKVNSEIREHRPDIFIGGALSEEPGGAPSLYVKGPAPELVHDLVAEAGGPINVVDEQPYTREELQERADRAFAALVDAGYPSVTTDVDLTGGGVIPAAVLQVGELSADPAEILAFVPADLRADVQLDVTIAPPRPSAEPGTWGPLAVVYQPGGFGPGVGLGPVTLRIGEACAWIESKQGQHATTLAFEGDHVDWRPATRRIVFTDRHGETVRLADGDRIEGGGVSLWPPEGSEGESGPAPTPEPGRRWGAWLDEAWLAEPDTSCPERLFFLSEVSVPKRSR